MTDSNPHDSQPLLRQLFAGRPRDLKRLQPREPEARAALLTALEGVHRDSTHAWERAFAGLALLHVNHGDASVLLEALSSESTDIALLALGELDELDLDPLLQASDPASTQRRAKLVARLGTLMSKHPVPNAVAHRLTSDFFDAMRVPLRGWLSDDDPARAVRLFRLHCERDCDEGSLDLLVEHLSQDPKRYHARGRGLHELSGILASWARKPGSPHAARAAVRVVELLAELRGREEGASRLNQTLDGSGLLGALGQAAPAGAADLLSDLMHWEALGGRLRLHALLNWSRIMGRLPDRCEAVVAGSLAGMDAHALQFVPLQELIEAGALSLDQVLDSIQGEDGEAWIATVQYWLDKPDAAARVERAVIARIRALCSQPFASACNPLSRWFEAMRPRWSDPAFREQLLACIRPELDRFAGEALTDPRTRWQFHSFAERFSALGFEGALPLDVLEPWYAMSLHWKRAGITWTQAAQLLVAEGIADESAVQVAAKMDAQDAEPGDDEDAWSQDTSHRLQTLLGKRVLSYHLDQELIEPPYAELLSALVRLASPPLEIADVAQDGVVEVLELPARRIVASDRGGMLDPEIRSLLDAGLALYSDIHGEQTVQFTLDGALHRFRIHSGDAIDADRVQDEVNRLLAQRAHPQRLFRLEFSTWSEGKVCEFLCAEPERFQRVVERLRLPLHSPGQTDSDPGPGVALSPRRPAGTPYPEWRQAPASRWDIPWSQPG